MAKMVKKPKMDKMAEIVELVKILNVGKIRNYDEARVFFQKNNNFIFSKVSLQKWEGAKNGGGSRPSY